MCFFINLQCGLLVIKANVAIRINFYNSKQLATIVASLKPEINSPATHRANVTLQVHDCFLLLIVDAEDATALRAAVNAYLRWINSTVNIVETIEHM